MPNKQNKPLDVLRAVVNRCIAEGAPVYTNVPPVTREFERQLSVIWTNTHPDRRSVVNGVRYMLVRRDEATMLVPLTDLTAEEIARRLGE